MKPIVNLLIAIQFSPELLDQIKAVSPRLVVKTTGAKNLEEIPPEIWQEIEILFTHKIIPNPDLAPNLKWIQFYRAGNELFMEAPILGKSDLIATSMSGASAPQVAEYVLEMILALGHRLPKIMENQKRGEWPVNRGEVYSPVELNQSTVGIIGYGSIGREVARLLYAFGATVLATKYDAMQPADPGYMVEGSGDPEGSYVLRLYPAQALNSMVKECDFVVVCVPLTRDTQGLIGNQQLAKMKQSAYLIDVSRGGIVDHSALITALDDDQIAGAALDVYPEEPLPDEDPLWKLPNVILTPHIAGISPFYNQRAVALFVDNLNRYLNGQDPLNLIDLQRGY